MITEKTNIEIKLVHDFIDSLIDDKLSISSVICYLSEVEELNFYSALKWIDQNQESLFYYSLPDQDFYIAASGEAKSFSFNSVQELNQFSSTFLNIKKNILHNFNIAGYHPPLFFIASKFPSDKTSDEWKSFEPVKLYVPELILIKSGRKIYSVTNINSDSVKDKKSLLEKILYFSERINNINPSFQFNNADYKITLSERKDFNDWQAKVNNILAGINRKEFDKVVLSRRTEFQLSQNPEPADLAFLLDKKYPGCFNFIYKFNDACFFSASPEKLFIIKNNAVYTEALAGSIERGRNDNEDKDFETALSESSKNINEHALVIHHLKNVLDKYCHNVEIEKSPSLKKLSNIQHLHTGLHGILNNDVDLFSLIQDIFPTPAVGGYPSGLTTKIINEVEDFDRGLFTGFIGWMNLQNDGEFIVSIRSGLIHKNKLYIYAGCGIVSGSVPQKEYEETQLKAEAIISLFNHEDKS